MPGIFSNTSWIRSLSRPAAVNGTLYSRRYSQTSRPVYPEAPYTTTGFVLIRFVLRSSVAGRLGAGRSGRALHTHTAVNRQADARDESGRVRGQEDNSVGHLSLFAESAQWSQSNHVADGRFHTGPEAQTDHVLGQLHSHLVGHQARIDAFPPDPLTKLSGLHRCPSGQPVAPGLGRRVAADPGE